MATPISDAACINMYIEAEHLAKKLNFNVIATSRDFELAGHNLLIFKTPSISNLLGYLKGYEKVVNEMNEE